MIGDDDISDIKRPFDCDMQHYFDFQDPDFDSHSLTPLSAQQPSLNDQTHWLNSLNPQQTSSVHSQDKQSILSA